MLERAAPAAAMAFVAYTLANSVKNLADEAHSFDGRFGERSASRNPKSESYFINADGLQIFWRTWFPDEPDEAHGVVVFAHGLAEHSGRYEVFGKSLAAANFIVYALDHQGHGASEGDRAHVVKFQDYVDDFLKFGAMVDARHPGLKRFMAGHSMGGLIAASAGLAEPKKWAGMILSGAALMPDPAVATPTKIALANALSNFLPKMPLDSLPPEAICGNAAVVSDYLNDPLVYKGGVRARLGVELLKAMAEVNAAAAEIKIPLMVQYGTQDQLCLPDGSETFFASVGTPTYKKRIEKYKGSLHEIYNEDPQSIADVISFLDEAMLEYGVSYD